MAKGQTPALTPETAEKYRQVVRLKAAGLTFDAIANEVGYASRSGAKEAYDAALKLYGREEVDNLRVLEGERIDELWRRIFQRILRAEQEDVETHEIVNLLNSAIRISKRRSDLFGLDAPRQHTITGPNGGALEFVTDIGAILEERLNAIADRDPVVISELDEPTD